MYYPILELYIVCRPVVRDYVLSIKLEEREIILSIKQDIRGALNVKYTEFVINKGTNVMWFNGDVGHEHDIVVTSESDNSSSIYQTGEFTEFEAGNYTFNEVGRFQYADTVEYDNGYIMSGNISVVDDGAGEEVQRADVTLGLLMVPTQDISQYTGDLQNRGFVLDSMHNFQDLRGGQSGTGDEQTLIVWRAPTGMETSNVLSQLAEFSEELPYS